MTHAESFLKVVPVSPSHISKAFNLISREHGSDMLLEALGFTAYIGYATGIYRNQPLTAIEREPQFRLESESEDK